MPFATWVWFSDRSRQLNIEFCCHRFSVPSPTLSRDQFKPSVLVPRLNFAWLFQNLTTTPEYSYQNAIVFAKYHYHQILVMSHCWPPLLWLLLWEETPLLGSSKTHHTAWPKPPNAELWAPQLTFEIIMVQVISHKLKSFCKIVNSQVGMQDSSLCLPFKYYLVPRK